MLRGLGWKNKICMIRDDFDTLKSEITQLFEDNKDVNSGFKVELNTCIDRVKLFLEIFENALDFYEAHQNTLNGQDLLRYLENSITYFKQALDGFRVYFNFLKNRDTYQNEKQIFDQLELRTQNLLRFDGLNPLLILTNSPYFLKQTAKEIPELKENLEFAKVWLQAQEKEIGVFYEKLDYLYKNTKNKLDLIEAQYLQKDYIKFFDEVADGKKIRDGKGEELKGFIGRIKGFVQFWEWGFGYKQNARIWLLTTFILFIIGFLMIGYEFHVLQYLDESQKVLLKEASFYILSFRVTIYAFLFYLIFTSYRNYANNTHLMNAYRQKSLNLKTYYNFLEHNIDGGLNKETKELIQENMAQIIAKNIFETVDTGYIKQSDGFSMIENLTQKISKS